MLNILFIGNGCGYSNTTIDYPYIYWVAPDVSKLSSDPTQAFKYSVCVKSCPKSDAAVPVECYSTSLFTNQPSNFKDCQYYPYSYSLAGKTIYGDPFRYDTELGKLF